MDILNNATLWVGISFALFIILVFKPFLKFTNENLNRKIDSIKSNIEEAKELKENAKKILSGYEKKKKNISNEISIMLDNAEKESLVIEKQMKKKFEQSLKRKEFIFKQKLEQDRLKFKKEITEEILFTAIDATKTRIIKNLSKGKNDSLIRDSIKNIKIKLN